jgi:membrane protease subunit HflC
MLVSLLLILECVYKVKDTEQVVVTQFGKPVGEPKITPGLKLKVPIYPENQLF